MLYLFGGIVIKNDDMFEIGAVLMVISLICMALNFIWFSWLVSKNILMEDFNDRKKNMGRI